MWSRVESSSFFLWSQELAQLNFIPERIEGIAADPTRFRHRLLNEDTCLLKRLAKCSKVVEKECYMPSVPGKKCFHRAEMQLLIALWVDRIPDAAMFMVAQCFWNGDLGQVEKVTIKLASLLLGPEWDFKCDVVQLSDVKQWENSFFTVNLLQALSLEKGERA